MKKKVLGLFLLGLFIMAANSFASNYMGLQIKGFIKGAEVTYKDADEITVRAGFGDCNGNYWELTADTDVDIYSALPSGEDFVYIYVDDSASSYPTPTIIGDVTEPAWSNAKMGWYNGDDRCIGVVWSPSTGREIANFSNNENNKYAFVDKYFQVLSGGNPDSTYKTLEATDHSPVNSKALMVHMYNSDSNAVVATVVSSYENINYSIVAYGFGYVVGKGWLQLGRNWTRDLKWYGIDSNDSNFEIRIYGYQIER